MIFFTSDLHLGHQSIIKLCNRPFNSVEEMDETLIDNWNKTVKNSDTVYIVGDLVWQASEVEKYLTRLAGKKILIIGNHDKWADNGRYLQYFEKITKYEEVSLNGHQLTLCHYPMIEWKNSRKIGTSRLGYLIYGHIHNNVRPQYKSLFETPNALNAGVDVNGFAPVPFDKLVSDNEAFSISALQKLSKQTERI